MTTAMAKVLKEHNRCELCGSTRELEAHHIIPRVLGGRDVPENILCVCKKCHSLLTPKSELIKLGLYAHSAVSIEKKFYRHFNDLEGDFTCTDLLDYLDNEVFPFVRQLQIAQGVPDVQ